MHYYMHYYIHYYSSGGRTGWPRRPGARRSGTQSASRLPAPGYGYSRYYIRLQLLAYTVTASSTRRAISQHLEALTADVRIGDAPERREYVLDSGWAALMTAHSSARRRCVQRSHSS